MELVIYAKNGNKIIQEPNNSSGGTWGLFTVETSKGKHFYCHANQAAAKIAKDAGVKTDDVINEMSYKNMYRILPNEAYNQKLKKFKQRV